MDKKDVLAGLFASWDAIDQLLAELPEADWRTPTPLPQWDLHDVVAHLIGAESMLLGIATPAPDVDVTTLAHVKNDRPTRTSPALTPDSPSTRWRPAWVSWSASWAGPRTAPGF